MSLQNSEMIATAAGLLEIEIIPAIPAQNFEHAEISRTWLAVVCHPHPLHGGSKDNKVVHTLCRAWRDMGIESIRFNFRGVGKSEGHFDEGDGELRDLQAVLAFAKTRFPEKTNLLLAGFSFGAYIAAQQAVQMPVEEADFFVLRQVCLVAPPVFYDNFPPVEKISTRPAVMQVIQGTEDEVVAFDLVKRWVSQGLLEQEKKIDFDVLEGASHFFHGRLSELKHLVQVRVQNLLDGD